MKGFKKLTGMCYMCMMKRMQYFRAGVTVRCMA